MLFAHIHDGEQVADQFKVIAEWSYATAGLGMPCHAEIWRMWAWSLMQRADMLGVAVPVPDDTKELRRP